MNIKTLYSIYIIVFNIIMPRNLHGGKQAKKGANKNVQAKKGKDETPLPDETENQHIGQIVKILGDCRYIAKIINKNTIALDELMVHLPGSLRRKYRISLSSIIIVSHREFENKGDICYLYSADDKEYLVGKGYIFENNNNNNNNEEEDEEEDDSNGFTFETNTKTKTTEIEESEFDINIDGL